MDAGVALKPIATGSRCPSRTGQREVRADRLSGDQLLRGPQKLPKLDSLDQVDPKLVATSRNWDSDRGAERLTGVAVDAVFDSVSVATTFQASSPNSA